MAIQQPHYRFTRAEYHRMVDAGILHEDSPVELIEGEILEMSPIGRRHKSCVNRIATLLFTLIEGAAILQVQSSIVLDDANEPEPDLVLLRWQADFYAERDETPEDVLLVIEVADTSEGYDRRTKGPLYARHGIPELWIVNLNRDQLLVFRDPSSEGYGTSQILRRGETVSPLAFPELQLAVDELIG